MKGEISQGLRNALARGDTIEKAIQSFINAGYTKEEVMETANSLNDSASQLLPTQQAPDSLEAPIPSSPVSPEIKNDYSEKILTPSPVPVPLNPVPLQQQSFGVPKKEGISKTKIAVLVSVLVVLLILLAASFLFKSQIASLFGA